jgi:hypothetical protein
LALSASISASFSAIRMLSLIKVHVLPRIYSDCHKNVPVWGLVFATITYAAILIIEKL